MKPLKYAFVITIILSSMTACIKKGQNPQDPYEKINRKVHSFNTALDEVVLRPPAKIYKSILPGPVRLGVSNFYDNLAMIPTVANDVLQWDLSHAIKDTWRFAINSSMGIGGIFDVASKFSLPPHYNDLGLTFAKWGDSNSPYLVLPFLGPSTIRDSMGMLFDYSILTIYPYIRNDKLIYSLAILRYIDLRSELLDTDKLIAQALDPYSFIRDAYLQHRNFLIKGKEHTPQNLYIEEDDDEYSPEESQKPRLPLRAKHVTSHSVST
jgi:phospholipid-binding lipoprotein MlaA